VSQSALKALDRMKKSTDTIVSVQSGVTKELMKAGSALDELNQSINRSVLKTYNNFVGLGQDFNAQEVNQILALTQKNATQKKTDMKKVVADFKKSVQSNEQTQELLKSRKEYKASLYSSYDLIVSIIPKMRLALNTITNSIISPDDFSKRSMSIYFDDKNLAPQDAEEIRRRMQRLMEKYGIEKDLKEDVVDTLVKGEKFWAILSMNEEIKSLLKESATEKNGGYHTLEGTCSSMLNEHVATVEETCLLDEGVYLFSEDKSKADRSKFARDLDDFIADNLVIGSSTQFLAEHQSLTEELENSAVLKSTHEMRASDQTKREGDVPDTAIDGLRLASDNAILKKLKADHVVKLEYDDRVYGYVYVDAIAIDEKDKTGKVKNSPAEQAGSDQNLVTAGVQGVLYSSSDIDKGVTGEKRAVINDPKLKYIADVFVNRLSKKENIRLLKKSEQLKHAIYHSLITKRITKDEKIRVVFFTPDEVVHIDRKESIFDNVLFFAKLYIATLITILMQNIVRGADKRAYYIDIGLENDAANAINGVIRDIKSKDLTNVHNMDMTSMLNILGDFNDYYIPSIDGEKPIEISTVDGLQNISLDNEFLNWLSNNIFSGIGLPAAYLTEVDNVDFAKALSMQNARFIRDIVSEQNTFGYGYSELLKKLYMKEFAAELSSKGNDDDSNGKEKTTTRLFDVDSIEARFPSPVSLNMTNLNDQIGNLTTLIDALSEVIDVKSEDKDAATPIFKREMFRKYLPNVNWEDVDGIVAKVKKEILTSKIKAKQPEGDGSEEPDAPDATSAPSTDVSMDDME
jgi:hypothetical protein